MEAFRENTAARIALPFFEPRADQGGLERRRPFSRRTGGSNRLRLLRAHIKPVAQSRAGEKSDEPAAFQVWLPGRARGHVARGPGPRGPLALTAATHRGLIIR